MGVEPEAETKALIAAIQSRQITRPKSHDSIEAADEHTSDKTAVPRHNLPAFADGFVGRRREIEKIHHHLTETDGRLLTLRGMGGIGKTRLSIQAVCELIETDHFSDGIFVVNLAGVESGDYLIPAIADALNFALTKATDPLEQLTNFLFGKEILLLLDNFEQLQSSASQLTKLLQHCPELTLFVTSRHQLNLAGETVLILDGLLLSKNRNSESEAVQLFQERARQFAPHLDIDNEKPFIQAICRLVEGMPLAIEMCAAWVQTLSSQEILEEIQRGLSLLEVGRADAPERHTSIRAVFQSSFKLLTPQEQQVLLALSIFRGGFSRTAAQEVANAMLMQLRSLVEKSLLGVRNDFTETRYQMHQLLRQFALEKIEDDHLAEGLKRHAQYYADLLAQLDKLRLTQENHKIVSVVFIEMDNLRSIWRWLGQQIGDNNISELLCEILEKLLPAWSFAYSYKTYFLEGKQLLTIVWQAMLDANWMNSETWRQRRTAAIVAANLGRSCLELGQFEEAIRLSQQALSILRNRAGDLEQLDTADQGDEEYISFALRTWGIANYRLGDLTESEENLLAGLEVASTDLTRAWAMQSLGTLFSNQGKYDLALTYLTEALPIFEALYDQVGLLSVNIAIGSVYGRQRQFDEATPRYREVVRLARQLEQKGMLMMALNNLAICLNKMGFNRQVADYFEEALSLAKETGNQRWQAMIAQDFGLILLERGQMQKAEENIRDGLTLAATLNSQPDVLAGLFPMAHWQAQNGRFEEALVAVGFIMNNDMTNEESRLYATDLWEELSSELPAVFTQRAESKLDSVSLDDILDMMVV